MKKIILLFTGFFICLYFIWVRLILTRMPRAIYFETNLFKFILYGFLFFLFLYLFLKQLYPGKSSNIIFRVIKEKLIAKCIKLYNGALEQVLIFFIDDYKFPILSELIYQTFYLISKISIASYFTKFNTFLFFLLMTRVPQLIVATCFCIDIIYFHKFFYFYKSIWLLIIPLFWRVFIGIIEHMVPFYTKAILVHFKITINYNDPKIENEGTGIYMERKDPSATILTVNEYKEMEEFYLHVFYIEEYFLPPFAVNLSQYLVSKILYRIYLFLYLLGFGYLAFRYGLGI